MIQPHARDVTDVVGYPWEEAVRLLTEQGLVVRGTVIGDRAGEGSARVIRQITRNGVSVLTGAEARWHLAP